MPKLLVKLDSSRHQQFTPPEGETTIGRGEDCTLVIPDASVSRRHARIVIKRGAATVQDLESQNGVLVNGARIDQPVRLKSRDKLQIGRFTLVFVGDDREDQFINGRFIAYLPTYKPSDLDPPEDSTMSMTVEQLRQMQKQSRVVDGGRLVREDNPKRFWYPGERSLTLGASANIEVEGWFTWGVCAEIGWDGKRHVLSRKGWFVTVSVNGTAAETQPLRAGDVVQVGRTTFRYEIDE
jgi:pSer/pThr/pTyr-binding forkhead associated (FHA) protein